MRAIRAFASILPALLLAACGPAPEPVTPGTSPTSPAPAASASAAPVASAPASAREEAPSPELKADFDLVDRDAAAAGDP